MILDHLFEDRNTTKSANPRLDRILSMLRARYPQARDDLEALVLSYRQDQSQDRTDISRLERENDQEEADIQELEHEIQRLRGRNVREDLRDPQDNPCWKGYHPVGTKEKHGRTVPNCVPRNEEASPWIKPPTNTFDTRAEAITYAKKHGGRIFRRVYTDPRTGIKNTTFVVKNTKAGALKEFSPPGGDNGDDGFSEETLKMLAAQWYNGDEDPEVEKTLAAAGWEVGQDESYDDAPGVFVVQSGDVNGNSYISWPAHELKQDVAEGTDEQNDPYRGVTPPQGKTAARNAYRLGKTYKNPHSPNYHKKDHAAWDRDYNSEMTRLKNKGVAEGSENSNAIIYDNGYVKIDGKMYKAKRINHESGMGIAIQTPNKMYFSPIENEYEMPSVTIHRALRLGGLKPTFNEGVAEGTGVTDYNPKSQGGTRKELLAKYHRTKHPKDAEAARKAGATQKELQTTTEAGPFSYGAKKPRKGSVADLANKKRQEQERRQKPIEPRDQMVGVAKVKTENLKNRINKNLNEVNPYLVQQGLEAVIDFLSKYPTATAVTAGAAGAIAGGAIIKKLVTKAWQNHKELEQLKQDILSWSYQKLHANKNVGKMGGKVAKIIQKEIERRKQNLPEQSAEEATRDHESRLSEVSGRGSTVLGLGMLNHDDVKRVINRALKINQPTASKAVETAVDILLDKKQSRLTKSVLQDLDMIVRRYEVPVSPECKKKLAVELSESMATSDPLRQQAHQAALSKLRTCEHPAFEMFVECWYHAHGGV